MEQIILPEVKEDKKGQNSSVFTISPLFPGYGHTVGNGLRRVLVSSLPGAAVTNVKIDGVTHEFSTLNGVKEDVVELLLNLKSLRVTMHETDEPVVLKLDKKGPGDVTAKDFTPNSKVTIANSNLHLATLAAKSSLSIEVSIEYGRGYDPVEKRDTKHQPLGVIAVDSLFTPVQEVVINVENTRVGKMTNYDELTLTVTTDGTITAKDALKSASAILVDQFHLLSTFDQVQAVPEVVETESTEVQSDLIAAGISPRIAKVLIENGYETSESIKSAPEDDLKQIAGLGPKAYAEIDKIRG